MGLINFLKQKFSRWKEEKEKSKEESTVQEESGEPVLPSAPLLDKKPVSETPEENVNPVLDNLRPEENVSSGSAQTCEGPEEVKPFETAEEIPQSAEAPAPAFEAESDHGTETGPSLSSPEPEESECEGIEDREIAPDWKELSAQPAEEESISDKSLPSKGEKELVPEEVPSEVGRPSIQEKAVEETSSQEKEVAVSSSSAPVQKEEKKNETESEVMDKYITGLDKSRMGFTDRMKKLAARNKVVNQEYFDQLERILIEADVGVDLSLELIRETASEAALQKIDDPQMLNDLLIDKMFIGYANEGGSFKTDLEMAEQGPTVVFMCGVNGGGKTTTTAKLAKKYKDRGKKVLLVAADTFRAGAVEQLTYWAGKVGVDILSRPMADPASLCFDALKKAKDENYDLVFVDTAGRLQNKKALMDELRKVVRVMKKVLPEAPHESLLVIDANTGQNGIDQAQVFKEAVSLTGIVITKMDGTSKGGILLAIRKQLSLPVRFIGLGEKMEDLEEFDLDKYLYGLLIGNEEE